MTDRVISLEEVKERTICSVNYLSHQLEKSDPELFEDDYLLKLIDRPLKYLAEIRQRPHLRLVGKTEGHVS